MVGRAWRAAALRHDFRVPSGRREAEHAVGTRDAFESKMAHIFKNLDAFFNGRPIEDQVNYKADLAAAS